MTQPVGQPPVSVNATYDQVTIGSKYVLVTESPSVTPERCVEGAAALGKQLNEHFGAPLPNGYAAGGNVRAATWCRLLCATRTCARREHWVCPLHMNSV